MKVPVKLLRPPFYLGDVVFHLRLQKKVCDLQRPIHEGTLVLVYIFVEIIK